MSEPILQLVRMAQTVSATKDFSLRATKRGQDELGALVDSFNAMLAQIQDRDQQLQQHNQTLQAEIVERRRAEEQLKAFTVQLEANNRELQDFAYVASHDLQEPLRKIQAFGDRLKTKCGEALSTDGRDYLARRCRTRPAACRF